MEGNPRDWIEFIKQPVVQEIALEISRRCVVNPDVVEVVEIPKEWFEEFQTLLKQNAWSLTPEDHNSPYISYAGVLLKAIKE
jgi:hypothetical protein